MQKIKVLVVEDEMVIAKSLTKAIESFGYTPLEPEISFSGAIESIKNNTPDIGIFDIQLAGKKSGIDLAKVVQEKYNFPFIFLTSNSDKDTLGDAKPTEPAAFLAKPFDKNELSNAMELAIYNYSKQEVKKVETLNSLLEKAFFVKKKESFIRINYSDILYIKSDNIYLEFFLENGKTYTHRSTINSFENELNNNFLRVHRRYIINLEYLSSVTLQYVSVNNEQIPIGPKYRQGLMQMIKTK